MSDDYSEKGTLFFMSDYKYISLKLESLTFSKLVNNEVPIAR